MGRGIAGSQAPRTTVSDGLCGRYTSPAATPHLPARLPARLQVYIWDTSTRKLLYKLPGHSGSVNEVVFHSKVGTWGERWGLRIWGRGH